MESLGSGVLKQIAESLHETMQCPICLSSLRPPVTLCTNGHGLCPDCKPQVETCPTCRQGFVDLKPIILHQLLEALPRACVFKSLGCNDFYIPGGEHESHCSFRTVDCKILTCEWAGQARRLEDHVTSTHADTAAVFEDGAKKDLTWDNFNCAEDTFIYTPLVMESQVFWAFISMSIQVKKLCLSVKHVASGPCDFDYFAIISFKSGNVEYTHTIKIPLDTTDCYVDFFEDHCMTIPQNMVSRFLNQESSLAYSVTVIKEKK